MNISRAPSAAARTAPDFQMTLRRRERCIDCSYFPRDEASDEQRIIIHARAQYFDAPDFHHNLSQRRSQLYMERGERNFAGCVRCVYQLQGDEQFMYAHAFWK
jgi:hypothetical protein